MILKEYKIQEIILDEGYAFRVWIKPDLSKDFVFKKPERNQALNKAISLIQELEKIN